MFEIVDVNCIFVMLFWEKCINFVTNQGTLSQKVCTNPVLMGRSFVPSAHSFALDIFVSLLIISFCEYAFLV